MKPDFSFKHPSNWIQKSSIDGGTASYVSFYDKDTYSQKCDEAINGATFCHETGQVANALVSVPSMSHAKKEYNIEYSSDFKEFAAKEKLEIVSAAASPHFQIFAGGFPPKKE